MAYGFKVEKLTANVVVLDDLSVTLTGAAGTQFDFTSKPAEDVALSEDLVAQITAGELAVVNPRDASDTLLLNTADSILAVQLHNNTHFGVVGGRLGAVDDPTVSLTDGTVLVYNATADEYEEKSAADLFTTLGRKETARTCTDGTPLTAAPFNGAYAPGGGTSGTGEYTGVDLTNAVGGVVLNLGDRVLVKDGPSGTTDIQNGIYVVTAAGAAGSLERAPDHDVDAEVGANDYLFVAEGTCADTSWTITTNDPITLNATAITWAQVTGPGAFIAGPGIDISGATISLDIDGLTVAASDGTDTIAFYDTSAGAHRKTTIDSFLADNDIVNGVTGTGIIVQTAPDTYVSRAITVDGLGALDGLSVVNGDGVAGAPTLGLDIQNLPSSTTVEATGRIAVWNPVSGANEFYTVSEVAGALAATDSFSTWAITGNQAGDASIAADSSTDTVTLDGGIGVTITGTAATDTVSLAFSRAGMADTPVVATDTIPFFDASNSNEPEFRSFGDALADLGVETDLEISTINGNPILTFTDTTRGSKRLSTSDVSFQWAENRLGHLDWLAIRGANDADSGHVMPHDGTVVWSTASCADANGDTLAIHLFVNGVDQGAIHTITGLNNTSVTFNNNTLNLDFAAGDRIRLQGMGAGNVIDDTVVDVGVRWRA